MDRARVLGHRERTQVENCSVWVNRNDGTHDADRDLLTGAATDRGLKAVKQGIVTWTHLRDALEVIHVHHGRCRAHTHLETWNPDGTKVIGEANDRVPLLLSHPSYRFSVNAVIAVPPMCEEAQEANEWTAVQTLSEHHCSRCVG